MIYSSEFVWMHFPKCAGTRISSIFEKYFSDSNDLVIDPVGKNKDPLIAWHDSVYQREARNTDFNLGDRTVICSFRRLASWLESRYNYEVQRSPQLQHDPELLLEGKFLERRGAVNHADRYVDRYLPRSILDRGEVRYIRTEFFEKDFQRVFSEYLDLSALDKQEYCRKENATKKSFLPNDIRDELYSPDSSVYSHCPRWLAIESEIY